MRGGKKILQWTCAALLFVSFAAFLPLHNADAAQITARSLTLESGGASAPYNGNGGSMPGGVVKHLFQFTLPTSGNVQSIQFNYCTTPADTGSLTCITPTGLVTTSATLLAQNGATGFSMVNTTNGAPYLTRSAASITGPQIVSYELGVITNPTDTNKTFFVRISTFTTSNATGSPTDTGSVAASTANPIVLTGIMPESLVFCTGATVGTTGGFPDCTTASNGAVSFDRLFSPTDTAIATSQMAASTNAGSGYAISLFGTTLTSGSNTITAMNTASGGDTAVRNSSQFGTNLKANSSGVSTPSVGAEVAPSVNGSNYRGEALTGYNTVDKFRFVSGENVADSGNATLGASDSQIFTNSYIVNVPGSQPAGTYTTTLTYICTPTF
jgi:hypothetical protein